jgi:hypothetical protein
MESDHYFTPYPINRLNNTLQIDEYAIKLDFVRKVFPGICIVGDFLSLMAEEKAILIKEFNKSMKTEQTLAEIIQEKIESDALAGRTVPEILSARTFKNDEEAPELIPHLIADNGVNIVMYGELVPISLIKEMYPNVDQTSVSVNLSKEQETRVWEAFNKRWAEETVKISGLGKTKFKADSQAERKPKKENVKQSIEDILAEREKTHGKYSDHAYVTQQIKISMKDSVNWSRLSYTQTETLDMIAHKIGRILSGNPNERDHWDDIAGYATLVSKEIDKWKAIQAQAQGEY